jgi:nucleoid-associated protein YgaU
MRKDVRMGFAVGGVLLAVLVVAILVFHRGKNADKAVAFDAGGKQSVATGSDVSQPDPGTSTETTALTDVGPAAAPTPPAPANNSTEQKPPADDSTQKGGAQWDALFASTAADPIKAQLTTDAGSKPKNKLKKHNSDGAPTGASDKRDAAPANTVANAPLDSGSMLVDPAPPTRLGSSERSTAAAPKQSGRTHVVAQGETFVSIARAVYGDGRYYQALVDANPTVAPEKLKPGMTISLPPDSQVKESHKTSKSTAGSSSSRASDGKTYTVQNGDSLYKIARKLYGNGEKSEDLYQANKQTIGPDSTRLKIGMVLTLPEAPTTR